MVEQHQAHGVGGHGLMHNANRSAEFLLTAEPNIDWIRKAIHVGYVTVNDTMEALNTTLEHLNETIGGTLTKDDIDILNRKAEMESVLKQHEGHDLMHHEIVMIIMIVTMIAQGALAWWRKENPQQYQKYTLFAMWLVPMLISLYSLFEHMLTVWSIFTIITGWIAFKATRKPLHNKTPKLVYQYFFIVYKVCYYVGLAGYFGTLFFVFGLGRALAVAPKETRQFIMDTCFLMIFYGLYYGCVLRDFAEYCAETMASTLGHYAQEGIPRKQLDAAACCVCGDDIDVTVDKEITLACQHKAHEPCIRGWVIVGKKMMCPYCKDKVDLRSISNAPWKSQDAAFTMLLDWLRYLVAWQPLIIICCTIVIRALDLH